MEYAHTHTYLGSIHTDNAVAVTCAVIKIGDCDSLLAGRNPVLLGGRVDLEDMSPGGVDRLFPGEQRTEERDNMRITADKTQNMHPLIHKPHLTTFCQTHRVTVCIEFLISLHYSMTVETLCCASRDAKSWESQHGQAGDNVTQTLNPHSNPNPLAHQHPPPLSKVTVTHIYCRCLCEAVHLMEDFPFEPNTFETLIYLW